MNYQQMAYKFAQSLIDNDSSQRCDFCATGYCHGNHESDCIIQQAINFINEYSAVNIDKQICDMDNK